MDTTDPEITFDERGICNHCRGYQDLVRERILPELDRQKALECLADEIKRAGEGKEYDCVIGVSGGVDSTYLAYRVKQMGLRPLAVHMDNGWNSELAVSNIEKVLKKLGIDLFTCVLDWEEFKHLQLAFLKASVSDAEIPTDHAIWAVLYQAAAERDIQYILLGTNVVTEAILPTSWTSGILDWRYISSIQRRFGTRPLRTFPHVDFFRLRYYYPYVKKIKVVSILDYMVYDKRETTRVLEEELGWRPYGGKHYESIYTRFFQGYILPRKFSIDKRRAHLSTLIMSGQTTRVEALAEMSKPAYAGYMMEEDMEYVLKKLQLSEVEFERIMALPVKTYRDYPNYAPLLKVIRALRLGQQARRLRLLPRAG